MSGECDKCGEHSSVTKLFYNLKNEFEKDGKLLSKNQEIEILKISVLCEINNTLIECLENIEKKLHLIN